MGHQLALKFRSKLQEIFFKLGCFSQRCSWAVLAVGFFILIGLSVGIITARIETDVEKLWMEGKLFVTGLSSYLLLGKGVKAHSNPTGQKARIKMSVCNRVE